VKRSSLLALLPLSLACSSEVVTTGLTEPLSVRGGQFHEGSLPGERPLTEAEILAGVEPKTPAFTTVSANLFPVFWGESGRSVSGRASPGTVAVGARFPDVGSGYWVLPAAGSDPTNNDEITFSLPVTVNAVLEPGRHRLHLSAIDANGNSGTHSPVDVCVSRPVPDNGNACDPTLVPPALVVSLSWDNAADLDLRVRTPSGKVVDGKAPSTGQKENGSVDNSVPGTGLLDFDSNAHCVNEGRHRENLVFQEKPETGTYLVYVNLFEPCGEHASNFSVTLTSPTAGEEADTYGVVETYRQAGALVAAQANAGKKLGLFVTEFKIQ
jgi:hypothetical protein